MWSASNLHKMLNVVLIVVGYVAVYVALDWITFFQVVPGTGFTPWNPPPAASLALLVIKGLRFAPALFIAGTTSDLVVAGYPLGFPASLTANAITAIGYTGVAAGLLRFAHADKGFPRVADIVCLLAISGAGSFVITSLMVGALAIVHDLAPNVVYRSVWDSFVGDFTGIIGLLPALLMFPQARERWKEVPPTARLLDIGLFVSGLTFALSMVFGVARSKELQFFYLALLPVMWIGVRHGLAWSAIAILVEQLVLVSTVAALGYPGADFLAYQILSLAMAATGLILGAVVTERQRAELQLRQQQAELYRTARITTAGALGAAVVHEISQPIATVATYAHVCARLIAAGPIDFALLDRTLASLGSEVRRAAEIVERLRDFLGRSEPRWCSIDLAGMSRKVIGALSDMARSQNVSIRIEAEPLPKIAADRVQLEQVLANLIRNAIEAAAECGDTDKRIWIRLRQANGEVELAVEDSGCGIPPELEQRLFNPFETSKPRGMGLGLSLSREIVKAHGGRLWHDATFTPGARFVMQLPQDGVEHR
jgi:signal transduction histidine kinase